MKKFGLLGYHFPFFHFFFWKKSEKRRILEWGSFFQFFFKFSRWGPALRGLRGPKSDIGAGRNFRLFFGNCSPRCSNLGGGRFRCYIILVTRGVSRPKLLEASSFGLTYVCQASGQRIGLSAKNCSRRAVFVWLRKVPFSEPNLAPVADFSKSATGTGLPKKCDFRTFFGLSKQSFIETLLALSRKNSRILFANFLHRLAGANRWFLVFLKTSDTAANFLLRKKFGRNDANAFAPLRANFRFAKIGFLPILCVAQNWPGAEIVQNFRPVNKLEN